MINPQWLHTFKTLVEVGHFTQTAKKLHMTQPGVSQHVKKLESACGCALLTREKKSFELTEQGRQVYAYARTVAREEALLLERLKFDDPHRGACSIACSGSMALFCYPLLLDLQKTYPELHFQLEAAPNRRIFGDIQSGDVDLGLVTEQPDGKLFSSDVIGTESLCLFLPASLSRRDVTFDLLRQLGLISHPDAEHYLSLYFEHCGDDRLKAADISQLPRAGYVNQIHQILLPVARGLGFTVLPRSAVVGFPEKSKLSIAAPRTAVQETLYLVRKRNRELPRRYQLVESLLGENLKLSG